MGIRYRPGNPGRHGGGGQPAEDLAALDDYGVGVKDPLTGLYESYDLPDGHPAKRTDEEGAPLDWEVVAEHFELVAADFASEYGVRLLGSGMRWPEFSWYVAGLWSCDSRLRRVLAPEPEPENDDEIPVEVG